MMSPTAAAPTADAAAPPGAALLDVLDPSPGAHALVIGRATLEMLCGLLRRGCAGAAEWRPDEAGLPTPDCVQLVVLTDPASLHEAATLVAIGRRALRQGGRIAVRDAGGRRSRVLAALLRAQGFVAVSTQDTADGALVFGDCPAPSAHA